MRNLSYRDWYIPLQQDWITLREAQQSMASVRAQQDEIPLMVQLVENPKFQIPGVRLFHGAVDLLQHDYIHIVLGRGLLEKDEAFTIGFTMGSTNKVSTAEEKLYAWISRYLYPGVYKFGKEDIEVFSHAVRLAYISECLALDEFDFSGWLDKPLRDIREHIGLEKDLVLAYYQLENKRYPSESECQRLLDKISRTVVVSSNENKRAM